MNPNSHDWREDCRGSATGPQPRNPREAINFPRKGN